MSRINRRSFLAIASGLLPSFFLFKAEALVGSNLDKAASSHGAVLTKSSSIKVGQSQIYTGKDSSGRSVEVILSRTETGLVALDGTCTHQGCAVALKKTKLICPCHGSVFQANSGAVVLGPNGSSKNSIKALRTYKVLEKSGNIYIS